MLDEEMNVEFIGSCHFNNYLPPQGR